MILYAYPVLWIPLAGVHRRIGMYMAILILLYPFYTILVIAITGYIGGPIITLLAMAYSKYAMPIYTYVYICNVIPQSNTVDMATPRDYM